MAGRSFLSLLENGVPDNRDHMVGYYYRNLGQNRMFPEFVVHMRDWVYVYNPWVDGVTEVHNSDYTGSPSLLAMWAATEYFPSIKKRVNFHKYRIMEELYNVRQDPNSYVNLAGEEEYQQRVQSMRQLLVEWMEQTDHPALELMKDPLNKKLIAKYMAWEKENAIVQLRQKKESRKKK